jgi:hypothetical protein
VKSNERMVAANGVGLCVQTFGDSADSPILLIAGAACSMEGWEEGFCERLENFKGRDRGTPQPQRRRRCLGSRTVVSDLFEKEPARRNQSSSDTTLIPPRTQYGAT